MICLVAQIYFPLLNVNHAISNDKTLLFLLFVFFSFSAYGQKVTKISGKVIDANSKGPLPFVNISFEGHAVGTTTDFNGKYYLETPWASEEIAASFVGYETMTKPVVIGQSQVINFEMISSEVQLEEVVIRSDKIKYRNKDNPAVDLIRKVIENKDNNRKEALDFYEYDQYEKVQFDLNNITEKFKNSWFMKEFQIVFDYVDTSEINGKPFLPIYLREVSSQIYYRKEPGSSKEIRHGVKLTEYGQYFDNRGLSKLIDKLYQKVDIYDNNIFLLSQQFMSPISGLAPATYKYYIVDTMEINGEKCFNLAFQPRNTTNLAFSGNLYITTDSTYAVKKFKMSLPKNANLNFIEELILEQEFDLIDGKAWMVTKDMINIDFNIFRLGIGMFGKKTVSYRNYVLNKERDDEFYEGLSNVIEPDEDKSNDTVFWQEARHQPLEPSEENIYQMIDEVTRLPAYRKRMDLIVLLLAGYKDFGPFEIGPVNTFYSFNDVEGFRMRVGGRTTTRFSEKVQFETYGAYGFRDKVVKYALIGNYYFSTKPLNAIRLTRQREINNPGEQLEFIMEDNFLLSFKRGVNDKKIYNSKYIAEYLRELNNGLSFSIGYKSLKQTPGGILDFRNRVADVSDNDLADNDVVTSEAFFNIRFAPNEQYYQGKRFRIPIINKYPIFNLNYSRGIDNLFNSEYTFNRVSFNVFKRMYMSPFGYSDVEIEGSKLFGQVPYPLLNIPRANQTFAYQLRSYNLMNFVEFISDQYVSLNYAHYFNGYLLNKIPLIKKLKLRSLVTFKGLWGSLSDKNDPDQNLELIPLPVNRDGTQATFPLTSRPYMEASVGVANIFKLFRIDLVKRLSYLDQPNVAQGFTVRARFKFEF